MISPLSPAGRLRSLATRPEPWFFLLACGVGVALSQLPLIPAGVILVIVALILLALIQPLAGLGLALLAAPWAALENVILGNPPVDSGQLLFLLTVISWFAWSIARDRRIRLPVTPLLIPLAIFMAVAAITLLDAPSLTFGLGELLKWGEMFLLVVIVVDIIQTYHRRQWAGLRPVDWVIGLVLLSALSQALIGIWQFGPRGHGPEHFEILGGFYRAYGTFEQPNPYGGFMAIMAMVAAGAAAGMAAEWWQGRKRRGEPGIGDPHPVVEEGGPLADFRQSPSALIYFCFLAICALAGGLALVLSWSRGAWLGFGAAGAVFVFFWPRRRWVGALLGVGGLVAFLAALQFGLVPAALSARLLSFGEDFRFGDVRAADINDANYAVLERLAHWQSAVAMADDQPWWGVGFGNYEPAYSDYALVNWPFPLGHAHNYYLNILAETGIIGMLAYLLVWGTIFWQTIYSLNRLTGRSRGLALGLLAGWSALTVHHLLDNLYVNNMFLHYGALFGILQVLFLEARKHDRLSDRGKVK